MFESSDKLIAATGGFAWQPPLSDAAMAVAWIGLGCLLAWMLTRTRKDAQAASRAKSEFLANVSHEIRTPMTAILGFADVLLGGAGPPEHLEAARTIKRNGEHLLGILDDILDLCKMDTGRLQIQRKACSPVDVVSEVASLMQARAAAKKLPLLLEYEGPVPETVWTDPARLRQILLNLVSNAIKFTDTGLVRVVTGLSDRGSRPRLRFDVIDTGLGMSEDELSQLFQPFTQADGSTKRRFGGTGLGLTVSRRLAGMLGGEITVSSVPGKGSTFRLTIDAGPLEGVPMLPRPAEVATDGGQEISPPTGLPPTLRGRVLLAEDGRDNQRLIAHILKRAGAEVMIADNGRLAVEKALAALPGFGRRHDDPKEPFDVVLMDMQMPVMDGYEATRWLRRAGYTRPVIALTAHALSDDRQKCLDAGCDEYLPKPIDRERLLHVVARHLGQSPPDDDSSPDDQDEPPDTISTTSSQATTETQVLRMPRAQAR